MSLEKYIGFNCGSADIVGVFRDSRTSYRLIFRDAYNRRLFMYNKNIGRYQYLIGCSNELINAVGEPNIRAIKTEAETLEINKGVILVKESRMEIQFNVDVKFQDVVVVFDPIRYSLPSTFTA